MWQAIPGEKWLGHILLINNAYKQCDVIVDNYCDNALNWHYHFLFSTRRTQIFSMKVDLQSVHALQTVW